MLLPGPTPAHGCLHIAHAEPDYLLALDRPSPGECSQQGAEHNHSREKQQTRRTFHGGTPGPPRIQRGPDGAQLAERQPAEQQSVAEASLQLFLRELVAQKQGHLPPEVQRSAAAAGEAWRAERKAHHNCTEAERNLTQAQQRCAAAQDRLSQASAAATHQPRDSAAQQAVEAASAAHAEAADALTAALQRVQRNRQAWTVAKAADAVFESKPGDAWEASEASPITLAEQAEAVAAAAAATAAVVAAATSGEPTDLSVAAAEPLAKADEKWVLSQQRKKAKHAAADAEIQKHAAALSAGGKENEVPASACRAKKQQQRPQQQAGARLTVPTSTGFGSSKRKGAATTHSKLSKQARR